MIVNKEDNGQKDEMRKDCSHENNKTQAPNNIGDQKEKEDRVPDKTKKNDIKKKKKMMPKEKSSVMFKPC